MEEHKIPHLVNLKTNIRIGKDECTGGSTQIDDLINIFFHTVEFDPGNMVFYRIGMRVLMTHNYTNNVLSTFVPLPVFDVGHMLLLDFILSCFDGS